MSTVKRTPAKSTIWADFERFGHKVEYEKRDTTYGLSEYAVYVDGNYAGYVSSNRETSSSTYAGTMIRYDRGEPVVWRSSTDRYCITRTTRAAAVLMCAEDYIRAQSK